MCPISDAQVSEFLQIIRQIEESHPEVTEKAEGLVNDLVDPLNADPQTCWNVLWCKPLYANRDQDAAGEWQARCKGILDKPEIWLEMRNDFGPFATRKVRVVENGKIKYKFAANGDAARYLESLPVPMDKLATINNATTHFETLVRLRPTQPFSGIAVVDRRTILDLCDSFGHGWGHTTVLHLLTDLGLSCKPDIHLARTCRHLGLNVSPAENLNLRDSLKVVEFVRVLITNAYGGVTRIRLRRIDKFLRRSISPRTRTRSKSVRSRLCRVSSTRSLKLSGPANWTRS